jgi:hypothetical protein
MFTRTTTRRIGRWGTAARAAVGVAMILGAFVIGVGTLDAIVGLLVFPIAVSGVVLLRGRNASQIRLTDARGHCFNCALIAAAFILVPVAALLFYGTSLLVAAARGYGGCELFALSNVAWNRDDQIACSLFDAVDRAERRVTARTTSR